MLSLKGEESKAVNDFCKATLSFFAGLQCSRMRTASVIPPLDTVYFLRQETK